MLIILKRKVKTDLKELRLNFQPPSAAFFRDVYSASHGIVYKVSCRTCPFTYVGERVKDVGSLGGLSTSLELIGISAPP